MGPAAIRRSIVGLILAATFVAMGWSTVAAAAIPGRTGNYGLHFLIDDGDSYSGARCGYTAGDSLHSIRIRRPIVYAYDRTSGIDQQKVGWAYRIDGTNDANLISATWTHLSPLSSVKTTTATDRVAAAFLPRTYTFSSAPTFAAYRVVLSMFWYRPAAHVSGRAVAPIENYDDLPGLDVLDLGCPAARPTTASARPAVDINAPIRQGHYGVHILIDDDQSFRGARCQYSGATLASIRVRQPIVFAYDRTHREDSQVIGWRYTIQGTNDDPGNSPTWTPTFSSGLKKLTVTDRQPAPFQPRTFRGDLSTYSAYSVVVEIYWYFPNATTVNGSAQILVENLDDSTTGDAVYSGCLVTHP